MTDKTTIERALTAAGGKMDKAARSLGVSRRTLQNRMRELGMVRAKAGRPKHRLYSRRARSWGTVAVGTAIVAGVAVAFAKSNGKPT
jgi:Bacterial regulatory protein, Fis family